MTTLLDAPATTRKERKMLQRQLASITEPETTTAAELPVVEQEPTSVVGDDTNLEQSMEVVADTNLEAVTEPVMEAVTEPSVPDDADDADLLTMPKPRTGGLPMVAFKPLQKDISDDDEVPYAAPMTETTYFDVDEDEWRSIGVEVDLSVPVKRESLAELEDRLADEVEKRAALAPIRAAEEKARKEKEAKEKAEAEAKHRSREKLANILLGVGTLAVICGAAIPFFPGF